MISPCRCAPVTLGRAAERQPLAARFFDMTKRDRMLLASQGVGINFDAI